MNIHELHKITGELIANGHGNEPIAVNINTFREGDNGENISPVEKAELVAVDITNPDDEADSGTEIMLVIDGGV